MVITVKHHIKEIAIKKALNQNICKYKISALGFNKKGELIYKAFNKPSKKSFNEKKGDGIHAEMTVMLKSGPSLHSILICRVNSSGDLLPISPCKSCQQKADELNIKIYSLKE